MRQLIDEDTDRGCNGHREVITQTIIADTLRTPTRWQHIDGDGGIGYRQCPEWSAMQRSDNRE